MLLKDLYSKQDSINILGTDTSIKLDTKNKLEILTTPQVLADIPYLKIINYSITKGYRHFFQ